MEIPIDVLAVQKQKYHIDKHMFYSCCIYSYKYELSMQVQSFSHVELNNGNKTVFGPLMFLGDNMISFTSKDAILLVETTKG
jgi:hypothetical protein